MRNFTIIIAILFAFNGYTQSWTQLNSLTSAELSAVCVIDNSNVFAGGKSYALYKSVDGGDNWAQITNTILSSIYDIDFIDSNLGYVAGESAYGEVMKTTDGGDSWTALNLNDDYPIIKVQFLNDQDGYFLSHDGTFYKTTDGGNTFSQTSLPFDDTLFCDMHFFNVDTGIVLDTNIIYQTFDAGSTWNTIHINNVASFYCFNFVDSVGYLLGYDFAASDVYLQTSTDYGTTWSTLPMPNIDQWSNSIYFHNAQFGHIIRWNKIYDTFDGGLTWSEVPLPSYAISAIDFHDCLGFVVGSNGSIGRTTSCGLSDFLDAGADIHKICNEPVQLVPTVTFSGMNPLSYIWTPFNGLSDSTIMYPIANPDITTTYTVTASDGFVSSTDSVTVFVDPLPDQEICMVTVDTVYGKNMIVWEKQSLPIESYYIWKETVIAGTYNLIDVVPYNSESVYIDMVSEPAVKSEKYKLSAVDSCGFFTEKGEYHKPIHLNVSEAVPTGYALTWEHYEGFDFGTYVIYRGHDLSSMDSIEAISYSPGTFTYTDLNNQTNDRFYMIAAIKPESCVSSGSNKTSIDYDRSISNIVDIASLAISEDEFPDDITIWPNPFSDKLHLSFDQSSSRIVKIIDLTGRVMLYKKVDSKDYCISTTSLPSGTYILQTITKNRTEVQRIIKQF